MWVQLAITALLPTNMDLFVGKSVIFSMCIQIKNCGYIKPDTTLTKLDTNGKPWILEVHKWQNHGWGGTVV
jgi:hypothetical protein